MWERKLLGLTNLFLYCGIIDISITITTYLFTQKAKESPFL
jgi:hypothetical protein